MKGSCSLSALSRSLPFTLSPLSSLIITPYKRGLMVVKHFAAHRFEPSGTNKILKS